MNWKNLAYIIGSTAAICNDFMLDDLSVDRNITVNGEPTRVNLLNGTYSQEDMTLLFNTKRNNIYMLFSSGDAYFLSNMGKDGTCFNTAGYSGIRFKILSINTFIAKLQRVDCDKNKTYLYSTDLVLPTTFSRPVYLPFSTDYPGIMSWGIFSPTNDVVVLISDIALVAAQKGCNDTVELLQSSSKSYQNLLRLLPFIVALWM